MFHIPYEWIDILGYIFFITYNYDFICMCLDFYNNLYIGTSRNFKLNHITKIAIENSSKYE